MELRAHRYSSMTEQYFTVMGVNPTPRQCKSCSHGENGSGICSRYGGGHMITVPASEMTSRTESVLIEAAVCNDNV